MYNAKEEGVFGGITEAAGIQWSYSKSAIAAGFLQLEYMLYLSKETTTLIISQVNYMYKGTLHDGSTIHSPL